MGTFINIDGDRLFMKQLIDTDKTSSNMQNKRRIIVPIKKHVDAILITYITSDKSVENIKIKDTVIHSVMKSYGLPITMSLSKDAKPSDFLPTIMSNIDLADCVLLVYPSAQPECRLPADYFGDVFNQEEIPQYNPIQDTELSLLEFELLYSIKKKKKILVFIDKYYSESNDNIFQLIRSSKIPYYTFASDLDESIVCTQFNTIKREVLQGGIGYFKKDDYCLTVLNKCTQREAVSQKTIGEYTNTSGEMNASPQSEIHILTNEWTNYDYTTMSSLTIAINTKKGVKYCYYAPQRYKNTVEAFKEVLKAYYKKSFKARKKVVAWIRMAKSKGCYLDEFFTVVCNKPVSNVISYLLSLCGQYDHERLDDILSLCHSANSDKPIDLHIDRNKLQEWIGGKLINNEKSIFRFLSNLGVLLKALRSDTKLCTNANINEFCDNLELLYNMYLLCQWQTSSDERVDKNFSTEDISNLIEYFRYKEYALGEGQPNNVIISEPVEEWLLPERENEYPGEIVLSEDEINCYLDNVVFLPIEDGNPFTLAYSFTLFLGYSPNGREYNESAAWYTTFSDNQSQGVDLIDNGLFMVDIGPTDTLFPEIKQIFRSIILSNDSVYEQLKSINSVIINTI